MDHFSSSSDDDDDHRFLQEILSKSSSKFKHQNPQTSSTTDAKKGQVGTGKDQKQMSASKVKREASGESDNA